MKTGLYLITATLCLSFNSLMAAEKHIEVTPQELVWVDGPDSLPAGAKMVVIEGDPSKNDLFTMRLKFPANYKIPAHWHPIVEHVTVLQGVFHMGSGDKLEENKGAKELPTGSFAAIPKKAHHFAWSGNEETIVQLHGVGPWGITYIDPNDDPRKNKRQ